ncbi:MAG: serine/threonine-protein kinase [Gemmatimonas sp.]
MTRDARELSDAALRHLQSTIDLPDAGPRFSVQSLIGQGGMGRVYAVHDRLLDRDVALKVLSLEAETADLAQRLAREARVLARLEHPGIAAIHDAGTLADGRPYYLMRLVRGASLVDPTLLGARGERLRLFLRVCDAVAFAHARGVVHRDLKPGNVMVGEYGDVVVLDWGIAKVFGPPSGEVSAMPSPVVASGRKAAEPEFDTADGVTVGTPGFMAPEQTAGNPVDARADVYGLGALLRHMLNGSADARATIPPPLSAIVNRAMSVEPAARYQRVDDLASDVRRWLDDESVSAYRETIVERSRRVYQRNRVLVLLLAAYVVVRVTILLWRGV